MEKINENDSKLVFKTEMNLTLANAIRRSVGEVSTLAIEEVDVYKNDSALYDEIIAHRLGLVPLKNQKLKEGQSVELKISVKGKEKGEDVLAGEMGDIVIYDAIPITYLGKDQELELVARAQMGVGRTHAKHMPGLVYYKVLNNIKVSKEGEKQAELAEIYPRTFEFDGKLKVKNGWADDLDQSDMKEFEGITITPTDETVIIIESWKQMSCKEIFLEAVKALDKQLSELSKEIK
jgi:DNA-directed RNA polymerase subunit D